MGHGQGDGPRRGQLGQCISLSLSLSRGHRPARPMPPPGNARAPAHHRIPRHLRVQVGSGLGRVWLARPDRNARIHNIILYTNIIIFATEYFFFFFVEWVGCCRSWTLLMLPLTPRTCKECASGGILWWFVNTWALEWSPSGNLEHQDKLGYPNLSHLS